MDKLTQKKQILEHLKKHGSITPLEALDNYGCMRLGARIWDLRHDGHQIRMELTRAFNIDTLKTSHYARYILVE